MEGEKWREATPVLETICVHVSVWGSKGNDEEEEYSNRARRLLEENGIGHVASKTGMVYGQV